MLLELERPAMKGAGHGKGGVAVFEAAVAKRHDHLALGNDPPIEIGDAMIRPGVGPRLAHLRPPSNSGARVSANSSTAAMSLSPSATSSAIDNAIMPRITNPIQSPT